MADNLIFPIGFDLDKAVKEAAEEWDGKYADKLEKAIQKRALAVKLKIDTKQLDSLDAVKKRLAQLRVEPITPETKTAIKELAAELRTLAKALEQVQKYSTRAGGTPEAVRNSRIAVNEERAKAQAALAAQRASRAEYNLAAARDKAARAAERGVSATRRANQEYHNQSSYLERLTKRMAAYWSIHQVSNFITSVREVTAQFELQRVSLGAIIQDQSRANQIFGEIKNFALKSPVSIMDLTKYTKQVAAYKIETDKLFDTTKRLADVSVGLGVPMERIVLAYGQVKAASYLRAAEIRQFTEAGIPMLELLAEKFTELNGEMVTTEQVMDMVSKRGVGFEMVEQIFKDMTSAGGMFYNMQEKQGNTLFGLWAKLGDAASVMYDEIGNTDDVNAGIKGLIELLTDLMRNWKAVANTAAWVVAPTALTAFMQNKGKSAIDMRVVKAIEQRRIAQERLNAATATGTAADKAAAQAALDKAITDEKAAIASRNRINQMNLAQRTIRQIGAGFVSIGKSLITGLGIGLVIGLVTTLAYKLFEAWENAHRLEDALEDIQKEGAIEAEASISNFNRLAKAITESADGSKKQADAFDELKRTYKDMIPMQDLTIEKLKAMNGNYTELTRSIREYIAMKTKEKEANKIAEEYGMQIAEAEKALFSKMKGRTIGGITFDDNNIRFFIDQFKEIAEKGGLGFIDAINETFRRFGSNVKFKNVFEMEGAGGISGYDKDLQDLFETTKAYNKAIDELDSRTTKASGAVGLFSGQMEALNEHMKEYIETNNLNESNMLDKQQIANERNLETLRMIIAAVPELSGRVGEFAHVVKDFDKSNPLNITVINFERLQELLKLIPSGSFDGATASANNFNASVLSANDSTTAFKTNVGTPGSPSLFNAATNGVNLFRNALLGASPALGMFFNELKSEKGLLQSMDPVIARTNLLVFRLAQEHGVASDKIEQFMRKNGESVEDYLKRLESLVPRFSSTLSSLSAAHNFMQGGMSYMLAPEFIDPKKNAEKEKQTKAQQDLANALIKEMRKQTAKVSKAATSHKRTSGAAKQDPRLQNLKEEISLTKKLYDEYKNLEKQIGATQAKAEIEKLFPSTIKNLGAKAKKYGFEFQTPFSDEDFKKNLRGFIAQMKKLQGERNKKGGLKFPTIGKDIEEAMYTLEKIDLDALSKKFEEKLKALADKISRTKAAKDFYDKILSQTGDYDVAARLTVHIYGEHGEDLKQQVIDEIQAMLSKVQEVEVDGTKVLQYTNLDFSDAIREDKSIDYDKLVADAERYYKTTKEISKETYDKILKMRDDARKDLSKTVEGWLKATEKAKTYSDKVVDITRKAGASIAEIQREIAIKRQELTEELVKEGADSGKETARAKSLRADIATMEELIERFRNKEAKELAQLEYDAFKDSPLYVQMFEDLEYASTSTLEAMKKKLREMMEMFGTSLEPTQIKEMMKRLEEIDNQLSVRNPWKALKAAWLDYKEAVKGFTLQGADANVGKAQANYDDALRRNNYDLGSEEVRNAQKSLTIAKEKLRISKMLTTEDGKRLKGQKALDRAALIANEEEAKARVELINAEQAYQKAIAKNGGGEDGAKSPEAQAARLVVEEKKKALEIAKGTNEVVQEEAKTAKTLKERMTAASNQILTYMNSAADLANSAADLTAAFGGSEEDVQFWNDIGDGIGKVTSGIGDIVSSAMKGDLAGIINGSLTAVPKMIVGFTDLFSAGRVRRANKEIKKQQELLEKLEKSYGRLNEAADKLFGVDYIANYNQREKVLQAEIAAKEKQLAAERSKGKKKDKDAIKGYTEAIEDLKKELGDMQSQVSERFLGTDLASAATDFAQTWLEARASFSNTTDAIKAKFKDMMKNLATNALLSKVFQVALEPVFDKVDELSDNPENLYNKAWFSDLMDLYGRQAEYADNASKLVEKRLKEAGVDLRERSDGLTGISRDIASASEESINGWAAGINTQNYYISYVPVIAEHVAVMRTLLEGGASVSASSTGYADLFTMQSQSLTHLQAIEANTALAAKRAEEAAVSAAETVSLLGKVIKPRGTRAAYVLNASM